MSCDVASLLSQNRCLNCLEPQTQTAVKLAMLCELLSVESWAMGRSGAQMVVPGDGAVTGSFAALVMVEDTVLTSFTGTNMTGTWTGITFSAGTQILGDITAFQVTSGRLIAYNSATVP